MVLLWLLAALVFLITLTAILAWLLYRHYKAMMKDFGTLLPIMLLMNDPKCFARTLEEYSAFASEEAEALGGSSPAKHGDSSPIQES